MWQPERLPYKVSSHPAFDGCGKIADLQFAFARRSKKVDVVGHEHCGVNPPIIQLPKGVLQRMQCFVIRQNRTTILYTNRNEVNNLPFLGEPNGDAWRMCHSEQNTLPSNCRASARLAFVSITDG